MIKYYYDLEQGTDEWSAIRCGLLTASEMKLILTPTLKIANNDKTRAHVYELAAQRITNYTEPFYYSDDMMRGDIDEIKARDLYSEKYASVKECGFVTRDCGGFLLGYSPDGLVGEDGLIEIKSRRQKFQIETITTEIVPEEYMLQIQTGLLVSGRDWLDFISYSAGLPMVTIRVYPNEVMQAAIIEAATAFEVQIKEKLDKYQSVLSSDARLIPTEREELTTGDIIL